MRLNFTPTEEVATEVDLGTSCPKLSGQVSVTSYTGLTSITCVGNDVTNFIISSVNDDNLQYINFASNKLTGSVDQYMPQNIITATFQSNTLDVPLANLSSYTLLENLNIGSNYSMGGGIPVLPASLKLFDAQFCSLTGNIPSLSSNINLQSVNVTSNDLTEFSGGTISSTVTSFLAENNNLVQGAVDGILAAVNTAGTNNGELNLGGTNSAPTSGSLNTDYIALSSRGWAVSIA